MIDCSTVVQEEEDMVFNLSSPYGASIKECLLEAAQQIDASASCTLYIYIYIYI